MTFLIDSLFLNKEYIENMKVTTYCFLPGIRFDPLPGEFEVKDGIAWIGNEYEPNTGQEKQEIVGCFLSYATDANIDDFLVEPDDLQDPQHKKYFKKIGLLLNKYRGELNEVATLIEGLVSLMTIHPLPPFLIRHVNVRLTAESEEEDKLIKEGKLHDTFGDIGMSRDNSVQVVGGIKDMLVFSKKAEERLSALSIYTMASRAEERFELEIAYSNFFRIIEGYFGDGSPNIENALKQKSTDIIAILQPDDDFLKGLHAILTHLKLPTKATSITDHAGIITDLVLLRHKLMHYNLTNQDKYFYSSMRVDLGVVVHSIHYLVFVILRKDIEGK